MSYQVLARKWRPQTFKEVVGQDPVLKVLTHALTQGKVHHAYLFSGTRGVGKTSIARLLAKGLNCENGITAEPCGQCDHCRDISKGCFVDLIEIDAASRTKVEDTREILDNIQYLPTRGRFKVYLIDEVHMLSRSSFNALLKTLEEPPEHVKFLLATTDPQKLPITILSRCLHLHLTPIPVFQITEQLEHILRLEKTEYQNQGLQLLAKAANGSMRDALSLTDQAIALGNGKVEATSVSVMLGLLDETIPFALIEALINVDANTLMAHLEHATRQGSDFETILSDTLALLHRIALLHFVPAALGEYQHKEERLRYFAQALTPQEIQLYYQILLEGKRTLAALDDKKMAVEMIFLRALAFQPKVFQTHVPAEVHHLESQGTISTQQPKKKASPQSAKVSPIPEQNSLAENDLSPLTQQILKEREQLKDSEALPKTKKPDAPKGRGEASRIKIKQNTLAVTSSKGKEADYRWTAKNILGKDNVIPTPQPLRNRIEYEKSPELLAKLIEETTEQDRWAATIEQLNLLPMIKQLAINAFLEETEQGECILHLRSCQTHMNKSTHCATLQTCLSALWGKNVTVSIVIDDTPTTLTPLELREALYHKKLSEAKKALQMDEKVSLLCHYFDAQVDEESIRPL